jgi:hypothetical protein
VASGPSKLGVNEWRVASEQIQRHETRTQELSSNTEGEAPDVEEAQRRRTQEPRIVKDGATAQIATEAPDRLRIES